MLKSDFRYNLIKAIAELDIDYYNNVKFIVIPVLEEGKKLNSTDDWMRLGILNRENLRNSYFDLDVVVSMLSGPCLRFPLWVTLELVETCGDEYIVELRTSLRFRTPSVLQNQETGHPPFKVIKNEQHK